MVENLIYKDEVYSIIGAAMTVHRILGHGFLEGVYQEALEIEFGLQKIPFEREKELKVLYKGLPLKKTYKADFICYGGIILELKALSMLEKAHKAQVLNYLKATGLKLGLIINFGTDTLQYERVPNLL